MGTLRVREVAAIVGLLFGWLVLLLLHTWATLAIYFDNCHHPFARTLLPIVYVLVLISLAVFIRRRIFRLLAVFEEVHHRHGLRRSERCSMHVPRNKERIHKTDPRNQNLSAKRPDLLLA
jgi:hypothetical protein